MKTIFVFVALLIPLNAGAGDWSTTINLGATGALNHSSLVVGLDDGSTIQLGILLDGTTTYTNGSHEIETELKVQHAQSRTPKLARFIKSQDSIDAQSTYLYRWLDRQWLGPFSRFKLTSQIFDSYTDATHLAGPFEPLSLRESMGLFANPITSEALTVKTKVAAASQQIISRGGSVLVDGDTQQLASSNAIGGEIEVELIGVIIDELIHWSLRTNLFQPITNSSINVDLDARLSVQLAEWLSLSYVVNAKRVPLILDAWQIQSGLLLTAGFGFKQEDSVQGNRTE